MSVETHRAEVAIAQNDVAQARDEAGQHEANDHEQDGEACRRDTDKTTRRLDGRLLRRLDHRRDGRIMQRVARGRIGGQHRGMANVSPTVVAGGDHQVVHTDQAQGQEGNDHQAGRQATDRAHPPIVTRRASQRPLRPLSRLYNPRYSAYASW